ncbi:MAG: dephospho-CoA kinase [Planctomycetes bacterium]|nr:dephospho-CoA kinase [Planctomycetota bacterium]
MPPWKGPKPVIGLLGGIGSGKSLVARLFSAQGCAVIDADALAKETLDEPDVKKTLASWWGPGVIGKDGRVDRRAVSKIVFADAAQLARLEALMHPRVIERRARLRELHMADTAVRAIVDDTPLLLEKGLEGDCDVLVFVDAPLEARVARVGATRGWTREELLSREKVQRPLDMKRRRADYVVQNDAAESECETHVRRVLSQIFQSDGS